MPKQICTFTSTGQIVKKEIALATPTQTKLFVFEDDSSIGALELFPAVWQAAERLVSPNSDTRSHALEELLELGAVRLSPLVAYLIATRLTDPDLEFRARIVEVLGGALSPDDKGRPTPEIVRRHLAGYLSQMETTQIQMIVQAAALSFELSQYTARLLNLCPNAGNHLAEILGDRTAGLQARQEAAHLIGQVGFEEAVPMLKRVQRRIETRQAGQASMAFAPKFEEDDGALLPVIREALNLLAVG